MTPKEKTVIRAIIKALESQERHASRDMDAFATSYPLDAGYRDQMKGKRASLLLQALVDAS